MVNLAIRVTAILLIVRRLSRRMERSQYSPGFVEDFHAWGVVQGGLSADAILSMMNSVLSRERAREAA